MCGIIGTTKVLERGVGYALDSLAHRGPDQRGTFADEHLALGHCRLSIIDLSGAGKQPMEDATGASTITYNGEVYNYRELKAALEAAGARFKTETDTEVILEGYAREGASFFNKLRGMWALAIYDKQKGQVILSRDQFGIKPLYYSMSDNRLSFASE
ncbi:MAG: asparagine synthetase B, partial [Patescibacteria group bacterium]|nr:asparagine synthetase B [Patescibacteria group bacterium]